MSEPLKMQLLRRALDEPAAVHVYLDYLAEHGHEDELRRYDEGGHVLSPTEPAAPTERRERLRSHPWWRWRR